MSGQLRALKNRIKSVESTKKITHAMEMVAAAKLRRFQDMLFKAKPYIEGHEKLLNRIIQAEKSQSKHNKKGKSLSERHPFFEERTETKTALLFLTSDTGLCGSYNSDLVEIANEYVKGLDHKPLFIGVGKQGIKAMQDKGLDAHASFIDIRASRVEETIKALRKTLEELYLEKRIDSIFVIYSHFLTLTTYKGVVEKLLPFSGEFGEKKEGEETKQEDTDYIFEPSPDIIFERLVPLYFESKIRTVFLESFVSEQIARMTAMHQATDNAKEMIDTLVLLRNKMRQAAITKEIIEIVSGSKAQKK